MKFLKNYKTTVQALLIVATTAAMLLDYITIEQMVAANSVWTALGLLAAKDNDVK